MSMPLTCHCTASKNAAKKFYEWALTPQAQQFAFAARGFQVPSNKATPVDARVPDIRKIKLIGRRQPAWPVKRHSSWPVGWG